MTTIREILQKLISNFSQHLTSQWCRIKVTYMSPEGRYLTLSDPAFIIIWEKMFVSVSNTGVDLWKSDYNPILL